MATQDRWFRGLEHLEDPHIGLVRVTLHWTDGEQSIIWTESREVAEEVRDFYYQNDDDSLERVVID